MQSSSSLVFVIFLSVCLPCQCEDVDSTTTTTTAEVVRCTDKELEQFSQEYEQCHSRALHQLQAEGTKLDSQTNSSEVRMSNSALCAALNSLIEDCTVILGWCFSSEEVAQTKLKQKELLKFAMARLIPDYIERNECFEGSVSNITDSVNVTDINSVDNNETEEKDVVVNVTDENNVDKNEPHSENLEELDSTIRPTTTPTTDKTSTAKVTSSTTNVSATTTTTPNTVTRSTTTTSTTTSTKTTLERTSKHPLTEDRYQTYENEISRYRPEVPTPFPGQQPLTDDRAQNGSGKRHDAIIYLCLLTFLFALF